MTTTQKHSLRFKIWTVKNLLDRTKQDKDRLNFKDCRNGRKLNFRTVGIQITDLSNSLHKGFV